MTRIINSHSSLAIHQLPIFPDGDGLGGNRRQVINRYIRCRSSHAWSLRKIWEEHVVAEVAQKILAQNMS